MKFDRFVGIPYADKGRGDEQGLDCWGLVHHVFREARGTALPSYCGRYVTAEDARALSALIADELDAWDRIEVGKEQAFDVVLMREAGFIRHIGIVTQPGMLLHVQRGETSVIERYHYGPLKHRIVGFYRYRESPEPEYRDHE